jgi:hypothetical protein
MDQYRSNSSWTVVTISQSKIDRMQNVLLFEGISFSSRSFDSIIYFTSIRFGEADNCLPCQLHRY